MSTVSASYAGNPKLPSTRRCASYGARTTVRKMDQAREGSSHSMPVSRIVEGEVLSREPSRNSASFNFREADLAGMPSNIPGKSSVAPMNIRAINIYLSCKQLLDPVCPIVDYYA